MASNSPFGKGVSSLLKSANSTASTIADFTDKEKAFDWADSAYTDEAYSGYSTYLQGRIGQLQSTGSVADASKALSLMGTLRSATHSNVSASITRENIQVMAGNASPQDKLNLITQQYQRANDNGDLTLAQSLMSQAYSLSQTIQYNAQQAQAAGVANAKANATVAAKGEDDAAVALQKELGQFNTDYTHAGAKDLTKTTADFVKSITPTLNALGVYFPAGDAPNYFDLVNGVNQAVFKHYTNEAQVWNGVDDDKAQAAVDKALAAQSSIKTAFGTMDVNELAQAQDDPGRFHLTPDPEFAGKGTGGPAGHTNPQDGYAFNATPDANGNFTGVQAVYSHNPAVSVPNDAAAQIKALGLQVVGGSAGSNGVQVVATNKSKAGTGTPDYLKKVLPPNVAVHLVYGPTGVQFEGDAADGSGKAVYTITKDASGKSAVYESSNMGDRLVGGDKGYNPFDTNGAQFNPKSGQHEQSAFSIANAEKNVSSWFGPTANRIGSLFGGHASASELIGGATQYQIAQTNAAAARALVAQPAPTLPNISLPQATPLPSIGINTAPAGSISIPTYSNPAISPKTVNPQQPTVNPQSPSGINLQGGGGIRLQ